MAYPCDPLVRNSGAVGAWLDVATTIADGEPVSMLVPDRLMGEAQLLVDPRVELVVCELDSCWLRDSGPTFVKSPRSIGAGSSPNSVDDVAERAESSASADPADPADCWSGLGAVCWTFNGWGGFEDRSWALDAAVGARVAACAGAGVYRSALVAEGGAVHTDGLGTLMTTESVLLDPLRNPGWTKQQVDDELCRQLGATKVIWLPRGLTGDMTSLVGGNGTNGHVDVFCAWVRPGRLVLHDQPDPQHPDHEVLAEAFEILSAATDASGRAIDIVRVPAPASGDSLRHDSYVNFAVTNGSVVVGTFDDAEADEYALTVLAAEFPGRRVRAVDARPIFDNGGGIHCITQQQPV
jgi:agmatine deiminase